MKSEQALKKYLEDHYQQELAQLAQAAKQQQERILSEYEEAGAKQAKQLLREREEDARKEAIRAVAHAKAAARSAKQEALQALTQATIRHAHQQLINAPLKQRRQSMQALKKNVQQTIQEQGLDSEAFTYQENLDALSITASSKELVIEESAYQQLAKHTNELTQQLQEVLRA